MRKQNGKIKIEVLCSIMDLSRQAYYKRRQTIEKEALDGLIVAQMALQKRKELKGALIGQRKMYQLLTPQLINAEIKIGRDAFYEIMRDFGLLIRRRRRRVITTNSNHPYFKYPNIIQDIQINRRNQVWVSDITYIETKHGFTYLFLITDAYTHKIMGYYLSRNLKAAGAIKALEMAIAVCSDPLDTLIHHSDRGIQYCSDCYTKLLKDNGIQISMTQNGDPYENAIAERVNGILKVEWIYQLNFDGYHDADQHIEEIINVYNKLRPHGSCSSLTPDEAYEQNALLRKTWKKYFKKQSTELLTKEAA